MPKTKLGECTHGHRIRSDCKICRYEIRINSKYNLTIHEFNDLWDKQNGRCSGCNSKFVIPWEREKHSNHFGRDYCCVDHDHMTNEVRGLLCGKCNIILGKCDDDPGILQSLIAYLEDTK